MYWLVEHKASLLTAEEDCDEEETRITGDDNRMDITMCSWYTGAMGVGAHVDIIMRKRRRVANHRMALFHVSLKHVPGEYGASVP